MKLCIIDADYYKEGNKTFIRLWCISEDGKRICLIDENYKPYFYIVPVENKIEEAEKEITKILKSSGFRFEIERTEKIVDGKKKPVLKISCFNHRDVQKMRNAIKHLEVQRGGELIINEYEYEINFYKKYLIDKKLSGLAWVEVNGQEIKKNWYVDKILKISEIKAIQEKKLPELKFLAFDIEAVEHGGEFTIIMISFYGKDFRKVISMQEIDKDFVKVVKSERELLHEFVKTIKEYNPDIIFTYNGDAFDWGLIDKKAEKYKIKLNLSRDKENVKFERRAKTSAARLHGIVHIDLFEFVNNILSPQLQTEVLTLDAVAAELLGDKKIEMEYEEILEAWQKKRELSKLAEYCLKDSELTYRLGIYLFKQISELSRIVGQIPWDVARYTYSQLVEWYLCRKAHEQERIIPNQPKWEEIQKRRAKPSYTGGFVKEPIAGLHENIAVLDFRSLYPSIMATFNVSPETLNCECCKQDGYRIEESNYWFCKKKQGFVSEVVKELIEKRAEIKKKMKSLDKKSEEYTLLNYEQIAIKTISNAMYGSFAFAGARWYCYECAQFLAAAGRSFIKLTISEAEKKGFEVIYGDTDSVFLKVKEGDISKKAIEFLEYMNKKLPGLIELDFQGVYVRGIFIPRGAAPGTAKKRYALIDKQGSLTIRGLETVRRDWCALAKNVQRKVLEIVLGENNVEKAVEYVRNVIEKLRKKEIRLKDLIIYEQLTKPLNEYKQISPHVIAAKKLQARGRSIGPGMIVMYVITKKGSSISEKAEPLEFASIEDIDVDYYINNQIIPAALRILQVLGVNEERLKGKTGLERFLS